ncbi:hypothetical protein ASG03_18425 [Rhizobium sp. Leaf341]|nr:hypothetical protein ASG03_18425 [Rhizobium sp. Leaf341]
MGNHTANHQVLWVEDTMDTKIWDQPVTLEMYGHGHYRIVTSAKEAAKVLRNEWPLRNGIFYERAVRTCKSVLQDAAQPEQSRLQFLQAAREADIKIVSC